MSSRPQTPLLVRVLRAPQRAEAAAARDLLAPAGRAGVPRVLLALGNDGEQGEGGGQCPRGERRAEAGAEGAVEGGVALEPGERVGGGGGAGGEEMEPVAELERREDGVDLHGTVELLKGRERGGGTVRAKRSWPVCL